MCAAVIIAVLLLFGIWLLGSDEPEVDRLEALNRESWDVLQSARSIHDEAAEALREMVAVANDSVPDRSRERS